jgi:hypothetical protein
MRLCLESSVVSFLARAVCCFGYFKAFFPLYRNLDLYGGWTREGAGGIQRRLERVENQHRVTPAVTYGNIDEIAIALHVEKEGRYVESIPMVPGALSTAILLRRKVVDFTSRKGLAPRN